MSASYFILFLLLVSFKNPIQHMLTQEFVMSKNAAGVTGSALYGGNQLSTSLSNGTFDTTFNFLINHADQMTYLKIQTKFACVTKIVLLIVVILLTPPLQFPVRSSLSALMQ